MVSCAVDQACDGRSLIFSFLALPIPSMRPELHRRLRWSRVNLPETKDANIVQPFKESIKIFGLVPERRASASQPKDSPQRRHRLQESEVGAAASAKAGEFDLLLRAPRRATRSTINQGEGSRAHVSPCSGTLATPLPQSYFRAFPVLLQGVDKGEPTCICAAVSRHRPNGGRLTSGQSS
jgi:hypothetical protein